MIPFFIAAWFGISGTTDAFFFAYGIILFLSNIFAPVVADVIVPYIAAARKEGRDVGRFVGGILGISGLGLLILEGLLLLLARPFLAVVTRFDQPTLQLIYSILLETAPLIILLVWTGILSGTLNAYRKFAIPAVSPALRAVVNICIIFALKNSLGVRAIALGYVAGEAVRLAVLMGVIIHMRLLRIRFSLVPSPFLRDFLKKASYQSVGMVAIWFKPLIDKVMASWLGEGSVSVLYYADRLYIIPIAFIGTGLLATTLSHWSSRYYESGVKTIARDVGRAAWMVGVVTILITVFLLLFYRPIVRIAFERGAFESGYVAEVQWVWFCYLLGLVPYTIARIYYQAHLVIKNTRFLMVYSFYLNGLAVLLNYLLMKRFGVAGIAISTTVSSVFALVCLRYYLHRKLRKLELNGAVKM